MPGHAETKKYLPGVSKLHFLSADPFQRGNVTLKSGFVCITAIGGIARDWVSKNWYFTDEEHERIFVCNDMGDVCVTLLTTDLKAPKAIAVDPLAG